MSTTYAGTDTKVKVGDSVRFVKTEVAAPLFSDAGPSYVSESPLSDLNATFTVVMVNDPDEHPGYVIGLTADRGDFEGGHSLEGFLDADDTSGWWARGDQLEKVED